MCNKSVASSTCALEFVPECFMTHKKCQNCLYLSIYYKLCSYMLFDLRIDDLCFFVFNSITDWHKTQKMWKSCVWRSFLIAYCPDEYKTLRMCDEAVDDSLGALKFIPDYFVTSKMIRNLYTAL